MTTEDRAPRDEDPLKPGALLAERYRIEHLLGRGGMGTVYLAEHTRVGRKVAIKVLDAQWVRHEEISRRFREEARAASAAGHPNIIEVFDAGELPDGRPYLVMEYLDGDELFSLIHEQAEALPLPEACRIVRDVARAITAAHAQGVVHRDLKPENVMVVRQPAFTVVKVLDFGIASLRNVKGRQPTAVGHVMGTPAYMAPEQARGDRVDAATDIYAIGVILHEALTGEVPFADLAPAGMLVEKISDAAPSVATVRADLPAPLVELVDECMAMEPEQRPSSAEEVATRLQQWLDEANARSPATEAVRTPMTEAVPDEAQPVLELVADLPPAAGPRRWILPAAALLLVFGLGAYALQRPSSADAHASTAPAPTTEQPAAAEPRPTEPPAAPITPSDDVGPDVDPAVVPDEPATAPTPPPSAEATAAEVPPDDAPAQPVASPGEATPPTETGDPPAPDPDSSICWRTRKRAQQARDIHDWNGVLRHTKSNRCWAEHSGDRRRLRTKAYMELGRWSSCVATGQGMSDGKVQQWVKLCRKREDLG